MKPSYITARLGCTLLCGCLLLSGCGLRAAAPDPGSPVTAETLVTAPTVSENLQTQVTALAVPEYPQMAPYPTVDPDHFDSEKYEQERQLWQKSVDAQRAEPGYADSLLNFWHTSVKTFLGKEDEQNKLFSPLNLYMALGLMSQVTGGSTQAEILNVIGAPDGETAREQLLDVWNAQYRDDGAASVLLANSLWLNNVLTYDQDTLDQLAEYGKAAVFSGVPGSEEMDEAYRTWLTEQTDGLLQEQTGSAALSPELVLGIASAVNYHAKWDREFSESQTRNRIFYGTDTKEVPFLHRDAPQDYFRGEDFEAVSLDLKNGGGRMWLLKPGSGISPESLLSSKETFRFLMDPFAWDQRQIVMVHFAMPKFDISNSTDLQEGLQALGVQEVFDSEKADFTPLLKTDARISLSSANHAVRFAADEEGITAVSYVELQMEGEGRPPEKEVAFILNHPFLFVLTGSDGLPLFAGILNEI